MSFRTICGKFENQQNIMGKWFWTNFVKNRFSKNCRQILLECSEYFRFCYIINYLLIGLFVPYRETLIPRFLQADLASSVGTSKPWA